MTEKVSVQAPGRYENIPVRLLRPSPHNLRLVNPDGSMRTEGSPSTHTEMCSTLSLARSIGQAGYQLSEPMIVVRDEDENGNICYTVEDGGLRLSALLILLDDKQEELKNLPHRPETVPCVVYEKNEIDAFIAWLPPHNRDVALARDGLFPGIRPYGVGTMGRRRPFPWYPRTVWRTVG